MGVCCSCCGSSRRDGEDDGALSAAELELQAQKAQADLKSLCIVRGMSAPTIEIEDRTKISGQGLALAAVVLEQDAAYWEVHVEQKSPEGSQDVTKSQVKINAMFGVATKKDRQFYTSLDDGADSEVAPEKSGTDFMCTIPVSDGDVVGVVMQQSDLPMLQFLLNGELLHDSSINRFRGVVYPSLFLPHDEDHIFSLRIVFKESDFLKKPPSSRFIPVMVARGLV